MPQSGTSCIVLYCFIDTEPLTLVSVLTHSIYYLYAAGQTSEGVLANFFNSLLTKKAGTGGPGTPGGGNNTPGTVRKSGENTHTYIHTLLLEVALVFYHQDSDHSFICVWKDFLLCHSFSAIGCFLLFVLWLFTPQLQPPYFFISLLSFCPLLQTSWT